MVRYEENCMKPIYQQSYAWRQERTIKYWDLIPKDTHNLVMSIGIKTK